MKMAGNQELCANNERTKSNVTNNVSFWTAKLWDLDHILFWLFLHCTQN